MRFVLPFSLPLSHHISHFSNITILGRKLFVIVTTAGIRIKLFLLTDTIKLNRVFHQDKSAARFCHQVAARDPDTFCNFYLVKSHKIVSNSATTKSRVKISTDLESFEF